jgi:hypothetical protein
MLSQITTAATHESVVDLIGIKLNDTNYGLWSQVVEIYISGKDKLGYINENIPQSIETYPAFRKWRTKIAVVFVFSLELRAGSFLKKISLNFTRS